MSRKQKDGILRGCIYGCAGFTVLILVVIIGFILIKGLPGITPAFLTHAYEDKTTYVTCGRYVDPQPDNGDNYVNTVGINLGVKDGQVVVTGMDSYSPVRSAVDGTGATYAVKKGDILTKFGAYDVEAAYKEEVTGGKLSEEAFLAEAVQQMEAQTDAALRLKVVRPGGGIVPMVVTTIYMILLSIGIAAPIGILAAVYLIEYAKPGKLLTVIHFAIENLAGIPSIIYGLFGSLFFVQIMRLQYSILAGALTVSIILLPTIITTTEEALKAIPRGYRESSLGLGATKLQTIGHVVLPNAIPGILTAVLLSIGRVVGESAALLLTAGTVAQIPKALFGNSASGATLTIKAYTLMKEENDLTTACAIGIILLMIIIGINTLSKWITRRMLRRQGR